MSHNLKLKLIVRTCIKWIFSLNVSPSLRTQLKSIWVRKFPDQFSTQFGRLLQPTKNYTLLGFFRCLKSFFLLTNEHKYTKNRWMNWLFSIKVLFQIVKEILNYHLKVSKSQWVFIFKIWPCLLRSVGLLSF